MPDVSRKLNKKKFKFNKNDDPISGLMFALSGYSEFLFKVYETNYPSTNKEFPIDHQLENITEVEKLSYEENIGVKTVFKFKK